MIAKRGIRRLATVAALLCASSSAALADAAGRALNCATPSKLLTIEAALERTASRISSGMPLTIVAMGSSSTVGVGASSPARSYPSQLEQELHERFPGVEIRVINHGVSGQDVPEEFNRLGRDVIAEHPDLVIWQVGTNAVLRRDDLIADEEMIGQGVASLKERRIDVVLMDLQYAPRVLARPAVAEMERLLVDIANRTQVGLFRRFAIMEEWEHTRQLTPDSAIGADGLHMTDVGYGCLADQLAEALTANWRSHEKLAKSPQRSPDAVAGIGRRTETDRTAPSRPH
jgi:acyl-CoA thioesterase-1